MKRKFSDLTEFTTTHPKSHILGRNACQSINCLGYKELKYLKHLKADSDLVWKIQVISI